MGRYTKETPRINVKFINSANEKELFEINDRNWMNLGELFSDSVASSIIENELKNKPQPDEIMVIAIGIFKKV